MRLIIFIWFLLVGKSVSNKGGLKIAQEFIDRLERVVHVKKVKNNVLSSIS